MVWFGHSRGGVTVLLAASRLFAGQNAMELPTPAGIVAAASPHHCCSLDPSAIERLRRRGWVESPSSRTGQVLRIGKTWLEEQEQDPESYDPLVAASRLGCPVLFVHGDADTTVLPASSHHLARAAGKNATLKIIPNASHTFNAPNPMALDGTPDHPATNQLLDSVGAFATGCC